MCRLCYNIVDAFKLVAELAKMVAQNIQLQKIDESKLFEFKIIQFSNKLESNILNKKLGLKLLLKLINSYARFVTIAKNVFLQQSSV